MRKYILQVCGILFIILLFFEVNLNRSKKSKFKRQKEADWHAVRHESNGSITFNSTIRQSWCDGCFEFRYKILKEEPATCLNPENIHLIFLISTTPLSLKKRMIIRETWASYSKKNSANIRYAFLLGRITEGAVQEMIDTEDKYYRDFVQGDFPENYYSLTLKTLMGYHWAAKHCPNDTFVIKTDDDVFINVPSISDIIYEHKTVLQHAVGGFCRYNIEPVRDIESKYYVSYAEFPEEKFKGYCSGTGYVTSMNVLQQVARISKNVPFFHLEDVYVAFCAEHLNFTLHHIDGFNTVYDEEKHPNLCSLKNDSVLVLHNFKKKPSFLLEIWNELCYD